MIAFSQFIADLRAELWPAGEAKPLRSVHTVYLKAAMADLQQWVPQLQELNTDVYARCDRYWEDAKSVIEAPNGKVRRVFTITNDEWRDKVFYESSNFTDLERVAKKLYGAETPPNTALPTLRFGYRYEESEVDSTVGRSRAGSWAIYRQKLFVAPWLQSNEKLVIEWDGIKSIWNEADVVDDDRWTAQEREAIKYYVLWQHHLYWTDERARAVDFKALYDSKLSDLIVTHNDRTRQQEEQYIPESVSHLTREMVEDDLDAADDADTECGNLGDTLPGVAEEGGPDVYSGIGTPEGVVAAALGSIYTDKTDPENPVQYNKVTGGSTSSGWQEMIAA